MLFSWGLTGVSFSCSTCFFFLFEFRFCYAISVLRITTFWLGLVAPICRRLGESFATRLLSGISTPSLVTLSLFRKSGLFDFFCSVVGNSSLDCTGSLFSSVLSTSAILCGFLGLISGREASRGSYVRPLASSKFKPFSLFYYFSIEP